ncbi:MAG: response regulator transcription factor [Armatimonadota bacterium]
MAAAGGRVRGATVLIVDDDEMLRDAVQRKLEGEQFKTITAETGEEALDVMSSSEGPTPDLVLLDIMLPDIEGTSVCQQIRQKSSVPVIMLTARNEEADRILGLELGADDYITKPFSPREMVARVKAVLRRVGPMATLTEKRVLEGAGVSLDLDSREVKVNDRPVDLTPTQMRLLQVLMEHPGRVFSTDELLDAVWDYRQYDPHLVETHISNLRNRIENNPKDPQRIVTVRSFGYKFVAD